MNDLFKATSCDFQKKTQVLTTGLAMFSMFFGAGNIVFPLLVGQQAQGMTVYAAAGLLVTAVIVPFSGLLAMLLFDGDYLRFFGRLGRVPGMVVALLILGLIGPFGGMPRCVTLAYSTMSTAIPGMSLPVFSFAACVVIFLLSFRENRIVAVLGCYLTPALLVCLFLIGVFGILHTGSVPQPSDLTPSDSFVMGVMEGYNTMDLLAAFFFSGVVLASLGKNAKEDARERFSITGKAAMLGACLLSTVYLVFSLVAARLGSALSGVPVDRLLGEVSLRVLGSQAGLVASLAISLTCLTTVIALAAVFAELMQLHVFRKRIGYVPSLILTLVLTSLTSTFEFTSIIRLLAPLLQLIYPALILLSLVNLSQRLWQLKKGSLQQSQANASQL